MPAKTRFFNLEAQGLVAGTTNKTSFFSPNPVCNEDSASCGDNQDKKQNFTNQNVRSVFRQKLLERKITEEPNEIQSRQAARDKDHRNEPNERAFGLATPISSFHCEFRFCHLNPRCGEANHVSQRLSEHDFGNLDGRRIAPVATG
jgi:hypothetical protein